MDDTNPGTQPAPGAETPAGGASETPELELELETEAVGDDQADGGEEELDDWEDEGKTYKVPKALKGHLLRDKDYTQSKQTVAEERKAIAAEKAEFAEVQKWHREKIDIIADLKTIDKQIAAFQALTPEQWDGMDPGQASKLNIRWSLLKDEHQRKYGELSQKEHQALEKQSAERTKLREDGLARIAKAIPGWNDELAGKLNAYAVENGFSPEELTEFVPRKNADAYVSVLHKAHLYDQLLAKQRARAAAPKEDAPAPTPVPKVGTRRSPPSSEPLDSDPVDVWKRKREKQLGVGAR